MSKFNAVYQQAFQNQIAQNDNDFMEENDTFGPSLDMAVSEMVDQVLSLLEDLPPEKRKQGKNVAARWIKTNIFDKINEADRNRGI